jgi:hypothetical protein
VRTCCAFADGVSLQDVEQSDTTATAAVSLYIVVTAASTAVAIVVPDDSVVTEPNRFGPAVVWPYHAGDGTTRIRCFIPGAGT